MFMLSRRKVSVMTLTWIVSGCARYHSANASTPARKAGSPIPPEPPDTSEYSIVYRPVRCSTVKSASRRNSTLSSKYSTKTSFSSLRGIEATSATTTSTDPHSSGVRRRTTNSASFAIIGSSRCPVARARTGRSESRAGRKVTESTNAAPTPNATKVPRWRNGGTSEKFMLRKPSAVVRLARKTGWRLTRNDSAIAARFNSPVRVRRARAPLPRSARVRDASACMTCRRVVRTWTQLAIATVSTMVGAAAEGGVNGKPAQPPRPIAARIDSATTSIVANVPPSPRVSSASISAITAKLTGMRVFMSSSEDSVKA